MVVNEALDGQEVAQAEGADAVQPEAVDLTADTATDAPPDAEPVAEQDTPDPLEALLSDDSLRSRLFEHPSVQEKLREREIAGGNRERERMKREAGAEDSVRQRMRMLARRWDELTPEERERDAGFTYSLAAGNVASRIAADWAEGLKEIGIPAAAREEAVRIFEDGVRHEDGSTGPNHDGYLRTLIKGAASAMAEEMLAERTKQIQADADKRITAEIKAARAEFAPRREGALPTPAGGVTGSGPTPEQYRSATRQQREQWRREGVQVAVA